MERNTEKILYTISNRLGAKPRYGILEFAVPFSGRLEQILEEGTVELNTEEDAKKLLKDVQKGNRCYGINFLNIGDKEKNTIEFREGNAELNPDELIGNININGGYVKGAEDIALSKIKTGKRTTREEDLLQFFSKITSYPIEEREKLQALLNIVVPKEERKFYIDRYEVNSLLIQEDDEIREGIESKVSKRNLDRNDIAREVFTGKDCVTGQEYGEGVSIITRNLQQGNLEMNIE